MVEMKKEVISEDIIVYLQTGGEGYHISANTYLLKGMENILIDAGFFVNEKVDIVILTHCHWDHVKFAKEYQKRGAKLIASKKTAKELKLASEAVSPIDKRKLHNSYIFPITVDKIIKEGDVISNGRFSLKVLEIPGHTPGSIALFDEKRKILFTGDTWYGDNKIGNWKHPGGNLKELEASINKLRKLNSKIIFPGHGDVKKG